MKKQNLIIFILAFVLTASFAGAMSFNVNYIPVKNQVYLDENAEYIVEITNNGNFDERYIIYTNDLRWHIDYEPSVIRVPKGGSMNVSLELLPSAWASTGPQIVSLTTESTRTEESIITESSIYVKDWSVKDRQYAPSIELRVTLDNDNDKIDPRKSIPVEVYLRNRNRLNIPELTIKLYSNLLYDEIVIPFEGLGELTEMFSFELDPLTVPQTDSLTIVLLMENQTVNEVKKNFKIIGYSDFVEEKDTKSELFKKTEDITITNKGNFEKSEIKRMEITFFKSLFTKTTPKSEKKYEKNRMVVYEWNVNLAPQEEKSIKIVKNYRSIIYVLMIVILLVVFYYMSRSPIITKKEILVIGSTRQGISEMKIIIYLKNRTSDIVNNIYISDKIPSLGELVKESYLGTLEPSKILIHDKKGTIAKWEIKSLEPFEERVITYKIKSKLNIIGGVTLPAARIKFDTKKGNERVVFSNKSELRLQQG
ncbi:MAG: hypothetical protein KKF44_05005 [Nanoarchaeota archaeon]|nr:hypothetical protein [Nanoarchaeota archaeon]